MDGDTNEPTELLEDNRLILRTKGNTSLRGSSDKILHLGKKVCVCVGRGGGGGGLGFCIKSVRKGEGVFVGIFVGKNTLYSLI